MKEFIKQHCRIIIIGLVVFIIIEAWCIAGIRNEHGFEVFRLERQIDTLNNMLEECYGRTMDSAEVLPSR